MKKRWQRVLSVLLSVLMMAAMAAPTTVFAADSDFTIVDGVLTKYNGDGGDVVIPEGVTSIGDWAFYNCTGLTSVTIPDSVTDIGFGAFRDCTGLISVTIPASVTGIGDGAFVNCGKLTDISVSSGNPSYTAVDGVLFSKDMTGLYTYPGSRQGAYTIPEGVTSIGFVAFRGCTGLTSVTIPDSVTSIGVGAFSDCSSLTNVTIPASVTDIGGDAFDGCTGLTDVYYGGTEAQWGAMSIGDNNNDPLLNATIHYADGMGSAGEAEAIPLHAVKYVPYSQQIIPNWYPTWTVTGTEGFRGDWMNFLDGVLSGVPTEAGEFEFSITVYDGGGDYTYRFALTVVENADQAVDASVSEGYEIERPIPDSVTGEDDQMFVVEDTADNVQVDTGSNYQRFLDVYLDGVKLTGGKVTDPAQADPNWDYYAEEGSTKITIFAQTFANRPEGSHTIAATFKPLDGSENKVDTVAQNFTIKRPAPADPKPTTPADPEPAQPADPQPATPAEPQPTAPGTETAELKVGDIVEFTGNIHYYSSNSTRPVACRPGQAKITQIYNGKHRYHLIAVTGGGSTVYGWVDAADIAGVQESAPAQSSFAAGARVTVRAGAKTYTGGSLAGFVYRNTYTIIEVVRDRVVIGINGAVTAAMNAGDLVPAD